MGAQVCNQCLHPTWDRGWGLDQSLMQDSTIKGHFSNRSMLPASASRPLPFSPLQLSTHLGDVHGLRLEHADEGASLEQAQVCSSQRTLPCCVQPLSVCCACARPAPIHVAQPTLICSVWQMA